MTSATPPEGWVPVWVDCRGPSPTVEWCDLGPCRFCEPFFDRTVEAALRQPFHQLFRVQTPIDVLESEGAKRPTGFIFHMGRCGSTLIAQLLASLESTVVISEAQPIDAVLRADVPDPDEALRISWLR